MKQEAEQLLGTLGEREATILRLYFGFNGEITRSFEEIGRLEEGESDKIDSTEKKAEMKTNLDTDLQLLHDSRFLRKN
ncbi:hypothetical protein Sjap_018096 [Stephania japonica]|uniref:Uncharacterized protein n=1 Tax=Stephania japonica TaxID=461633 RepID=A0AAP0NMS6_9MAGN